MSSRDNYNRLATMMIFYKVAVCLTIVALSEVDGSAIRSLSAANPFPSIPDHRPRRSRQVSTESDREPASYSSDHSAGYRFGDEFFNHPAAETAEATQTAISGLQNGKGPDGCERVVKDSMVCMVCKDPRTNSKYEQCSYVARPNERAQSYVKSRSYNGRPESRANEEASEGNEEEEEEEEEEEDKPKNASYRYRDEDGDGDGNEEEKDGSRSYEYEEPRKYSQDDEDNEKYEERESSPSSPPFRSVNQYGGDEDAEQNEDSRQNYGSDEPRDYEESRSNYQLDSGREPSPKLKKERQNERREANGESSSEPSAGNKKKRCREIQKDTMTCVVCTDPENGGNFEKCSYSHQPNDKLYKYSKSKRFGYPDPADDESSYPEETKRVLEVVDSTAKKPSTKNPVCRKIRKNSSTLCTVCKNTKTGESSEQCEYNLKVEPNARGTSWTSDSRS